MPHVPRFLARVFGPPAPGPRRRRGWLAFLLTLTCPGWGQLYNGDLRWAAACFVLAFVSTLVSELWLFDSIGKLVFAMGAGLALGLALSVQAWLRARRIGELERKSWQRWWVYLLFVFVTFGVPDGYGLLMPQRLRSFQIPSESMVPNLLVGDRLVADGWAYWHDEPKRGDIVVFDWPKDPGTNFLIELFGVDHDNAAAKLVGYSYTKFVKRLVGVPGDKIELKHGELYLNDKLVPQRRSETPIATDHGWRVTELVEDLGGVLHTMQRAQPENDADFGPVTVPAGSYFMMGDNRDRSNDSRSWGFVKRDALDGRMLFVYVSWNAEAFKKHRDENPGDFFGALKAGIRWSRFGKKVGGFVPETGNAAAL